MGTGLGPCGGPFQRCQRALRLHTLLPDTFGVLQRRLCCSFIDVCRHAIDLGTGPQLCCVLSTGRAADMFERSAS